MRKKYLLAGTLAIAKLLSDAEVAYAPTMSPSYFNSQSRTIETRKEDFLEKMARENGEKMSKTLSSFSQDYNISYFENDADKILVARLMMGEDEDNPDICKIADAFTVLNRMKKQKEDYGKTLKEVILKPWQYSCFNEGTASNAFLKKPLEHNAADFLGNLPLAEDFLNGKYEDPTHGATHYYNPKKVATPFWTRNMIFCGKIGEHRYYKERQ